MARDPGGGRSWLGGLLLLALAGCSLGPRARPPVQNPEGHPRQVLILTPERRSLPAKLGKDALRTLDGAVSRGGLEARFEGEFEQLRDHDLRTELLGSEDPESIARACRSLGVGWVIKGWIGSPSEGLLSYAFTLLRADGSVRGVAGSRQPLPIADAFSSLRSRLQALLEAQEETSAGSAGATGPAEPWWLRQRISLRGDFEACVAEAQMSDPQASGHTPQLMLRVRVETDGRVSEVEPEEGSLISQDLERCIVERLQRVELSRAPSKITDLELPVPLR